MFNLSPVGIVGGTLSRLPPRQEDAYASRARDGKRRPDRVIGLYVMFILGLAVVFLTGFHHQRNPLRSWRRAVLLR